MSTKYDRAESLKALAEAKSGATLAKVRNAIDEMKKNSTPITFQSVAKYANVSKAWLYGNAEIATQIRDNRDNKDVVRRMLDKDSVIAQKNKQIDVLKKRIAMMSSEIESLKQQLEAAYGELYRG
jgi:hypothetical protein